MRIGRWKKGTSFMLMVLLILSVMLTSSPEVLAAEVILSTHTRAGLQQAIDEAGTTPTVIYITEDFAFDSVAVRIPAGANIIIKSNDDHIFTLSQSSKNHVRRRHFIVSAMLTLENIILDGGIGTLGENQYGGGVQVDATGKLIMNSGAVVQNCYASHYTEDNVYNQSALGGGIVVLLGGSLEMNEGSVVQGNIADGDGHGGGIYVGFGSHLVITGGKIINNTATGKAYGGGVKVYKKGDFVMGGDALISGNKSGYAGGGVFVGETSGMDTVGGGSFKMNGGTISDNSAAAGGGIFSRGSAVELIISHGEISNNTTTTGNGGGIYVYFSTLTTHNGVISGNSSAAQGGGIFVNEGKLILNTTSVTGNKAPNHFGGGIYINSNASGDTMTVGGESNIMDNSAVNGGGIYSGGSNGTISVSDTTTIESNHASNDGGGIYVAKNNTLNIDGNCSVINNSAQQDGGGIYTEDTTYQDLASDYANLSIGASTVFHGNSADAACVPPENAASRYPNVQFASTSTKSHPINNYDINYQNDEPLTCKLTYDANGGTGGYTSPDTKLGSSVTVLSVEATGITKAGYQFTGWNTAPDGKGTSYSPDSEIRLWNNTTLYAQWAPAEAEDLPIPGNPSTGDENEMPLLVGMLLISLIMGVAALLGHRKKAARF